MGRRTGKSPGYIEHRQPQWRRLRQCRGPSWTLWVARLFVISSALGHTADATRQFERCVCRWWRHQALNNLWYTCLQASNHNSAKDRICTWHYKDYSNHSVCIHGTVFTPYSTSKRFGDSDKANHISRHIISSGRLFTTTRTLNTFFAKRLHEELN